MKTVEYIFGRHKTEKGIKWREGEVTKAYVPEVHTVFRVIVWVRIGTYGKVGTDEELVTLQAR